MDNILKTDVDEEQIAPYMEDINRQFEYIDKEDLIKKIVTSTFGRFLDYYKNAPEIEKPSARSSREEGRSGRSEGRTTRSRGARKRRALSDSLLTSVRMTASILVRSCNSLIRI